MKHRILVLATLLCSLGALGAQMPGPVPKAELLARRARLVERIGQGVAIIPGARSNPSYDEFRQNHRFYYLTGLETADSYLVVSGRTGRSILVTPRIEYGSGWGGRTWNSPDELVARGAADEVLLAPALDLDLLRGLLEEGGEETAIFLPRDPAERGMIVDDAVSPWYRRFDRSRHPLDWEEARESRLERELGAAFPGRKIADIAKFLKQERVRKSAYEQEMMARTTEISAAAMIAVIAACKPGMHEYELGALFEYEVKRRGAQGLGYAAIVGSGPNSCLPHYIRKTRRLEKGDLVVCDAASSWGYYVSDLTRTFPVSGRFDREQRKVYEAVLAAQQAAIDACKPGVNFMTLNRIANKVIEERGYGRYIMHGLGHHVGMSVHDPGGFFFKLEPGQVLTIEPGIYIPEKNIGVRIEDVVLVTEDGCRLLSSDLPRDPDEIEALMKKRAR